jgi:DNA polymerase-3 subunit delta
LLRNSRAKNPSCQSPVFAGACDPLMRLRPEQLAAHLKQRLAPIYLIHGDEPLLINESSDAIRRAARQQDYDEREILSVDTGFDWNLLLFTANSGSLFASRRLLELRLGNSKPGDAGSKAFQAYCKRVPDDIILLVICGKLDQSSQRSRWFMALDQIGVTIQTWPVDARQLPGWIETRMRRKGLQPTAEAVALLASRVEGNLLAAAQEIDKLFLLYGHTRLDAGQLLTAVNDSARYSIYDLADTALGGEAVRAVRILDSLHVEGTDPVLILWALQREIRLLLRIRFAIDKGLTPAKALNQHKVWEKRKPLLSASLKRLPAARLQQLLQHCAHLDRVIKGVEQGQPWNDLLMISLELAGQPLPLPQELNR